MGLDNVVVRDIVHNPSNKDEILGTSFFLKLGGGIATVCIAVGAASFFQASDPRMALLVGIIAAGTIFQAFDAIDFWFQSQVISKYTVYAKNAAFLLISILKVVLILAKASIVAFAVAGIAEIALGAVGLVAVYRFRGHRIRDWSFRLSVAGKLLEDSWPLILSSVIVMIYIRIDQLMIGRILGSREVGIYSVAVTLTEVWYFIPMAITASVLPGIIDAKKRSEALFYDRLQQLYLFMFWVSLSVPVLLSIYSSRIILLVYGEDYARASTALTIMCWTGIFVSSGLVSNNWYLINNLNRYTFYRGIAGVVINIALNLILIPRHGINGAAAATLISQFAASYLFDLINKSTRIIFRMKSRTYFLFLPMTIRYLKLLFTEIRKNRK